MRHRLRRRLRPALSLLCCLALWSAGAGPLALLALLGALRLPDDGAPMEPIRLVIHPSGRVLPLRRDGSPLTGGSGARRSAPTAAELVKR